MMLLSMAEDKKIMAYPCSRYGRNNIHEKDDDEDNTLSRSSSIGEESTTSTNGSLSSSSDMADDASSSSPSCSSSSNSSGSDLYDLSELMVQLPIKRGLSRFYQGKSQSFTSLSRVKSIEDLAKKGSPYRKKMKSCKSHGGGLDSYKSFTLPKAIITKKTLKNPLSSSPIKRVSFLSNCSPSLFSMEKS